MTRRQPAIHATRDTATVVKDLAKVFNTTPAISWTGAVDRIVTAFACQRTTATKMLRQAIDDGALYMLEFSDGSLARAILVGQDPVEVPGVAYFISDYITGKLQHNNDPAYTQLRVRGDGVQAVALLGRFDQWLVEYMKTTADKDAARQERETAEQQSEEELARAAFPALAPVADFGTAWKDRTQGSGKRAPVKVDLYQMGNGTAALRIDLFGKRAEQAGPKLLALLEEFFVLPDDGQEGS